MSNDVADKKGTPECPVDYLLTPILTSQKNSGVFVLIVSCLVL